MVDEPIYEKGLLLIGPAVHTKIIVIIVYRNVKFKSHHFKNVAIAMTSKPTIRMYLKL